ncbi:MAG: B12-binding domain-containing radical SAM protein [Planctomycetes bacterium]|nr:B12-binding domain-containing radical SAM protein [Planctomycetota bacterium]
MRLTLIQPCIGRRSGERYMRTWLMEPLGIALLAGLTPGDVDVSFYDDRLEPIPYDAPADLVAITVETYTARRAYEIASEYRRRNVPVVMGGFHASLCPEEVSRFADATVVGEAEHVWAEVLDDAMHRSLKRLYRCESRPVLEGRRVDRTVFTGRKYLPVRLLEFGRGCVHRCEFCSIQAMFGGTCHRRPVDEVLKEIRDTRAGARFFFFVDDNFAADRKGLKSFLKELIPLDIRWVSQVSIEAAHDEELLDLMARSGCQCVLIGFESLDADSLHMMNKDFNIDSGGYDAALANLRRYGIPVYGTFLFGYDGDGPESFGLSLGFAVDNALFLAAFNHVTPFPGTPLYQRLQDENRLLFEAWWLADDYSYGQIPFRPARMDPWTLERGCFAARRSFYNWRSIVRRGLAAVNRKSLGTLRTYLVANLMHRNDIGQRRRHPLGDRTWTGALIEAGR